MQIEFIAGSIIGTIIGWFLFEFIKSCKRVTPQHEEWIHKVNNHEYCDYTKAKSIYHKDMMSGVEGSTIVVRDETGNVRYHGKASDYFERYEHGEI